MKKRLIWALLALIVPTSGYAQLAYKLPPQPVIDVVDAPRPPVEFPSPDHAWLLVTNDDDIRSMAELARPFLKFAGLQRAPERVGGPSRRGHALTGHAAAGVNQDADTNRRRLGGENGHVLGRLFVVDHEVIFREAANNRTIRRLDGDIEIDQFNAGLELRLPAGDDGHRRQQGNDDECVFHRRRNAISMPHSTAFWCMYRFRSHRIHRDH